MEQVAVLGFPISTMTVGRLPFNFLNSTCIDKFENFAAKKAEGKIAIHPERENQQDTSEDSINVLRAPGSMIPSVVKEHQTTKPVSSL